MFSLLTICVLLVFPRTFRAFRLGDIRIFHHEFFERGVFLGHERRHAIDRVGLFGGVVLCGRNALLRRDGLIRVVRGGRFWRWHVGRCGRGGLLGPWVVLAARTGSGTSLRRPEELRIWAGQAEAQRFGAWGRRVRRHGARRAERVLRALPVR